MGKKKTVAFVLIGILVLIAILFFSNTWAERKVVESLDAELGNALKYETVDVNLVRGRIYLEEPELEFANFKLELKELEIKGLGYFDLFFEEKVTVQTLRMEGPKVIFYTQNRDTSDTSSKLKRDFLIKNLEISKGTLALAETDSSEAFFYTEIRELRLQSINVNEKTLNQKIPFSYENPEIFADSVYLNLDRQHYLSIGALELQDDQFSAGDLRVIPKFSKSDFQKQIPFEKDRFELHVKKLGAKDIAWGFQNDSLYLRNELLTFEGANLEVYRDKLVADDTRIKILYSEKIRNLPFFLNIQKLEVIDSRIVYEERIREGVGPGKVFFTNLNATVSGLTNMDMDRNDFPSTIMEAKANLMGESNLNFHLEFNVNDLQDRYTFSGNSGPVSSKGINNFLRPALNIQAEGGIASLAFNFSGNEEGASGDMQLKYKDFKIAVLRDDGTKKDDILSAIANFFIGDKALNEEATRENLEVTRDKTKSFWNLVWSCIEKGAFKTLL